MVVSPSSAKPSASWGAVLALSLVAFALVASEFMPVSLLTPIAQELGISEGRAGQGIAVSGLFALVSSLLTAAIAARIARKPLLLALVLLMVLSGTLVALAPGFMLFMLGRALLGVVIGGFWSLSAATALQLVPSHRVPRALAIVNGGNALATMIAAPLGSFLGGLIGWRGAFFCIVPVAVLAWVWLQFSLPRLPATSRAAATRPLALLGKAPVALGMTAVGLFFMGQFTLFTYLRPFLEKVTGVHDSLLSLMLLILGVTGLAGTLLLERWLHSGLYRTLAAIALLMSLLALALVCFGHSLVATAVLLGLWGAVATAAPAGWWTWLARTLPDDAEAGGGLMVAVVQLAITLGAIVGGWVFDAGGYRPTFELSAALLGSATLLAMGTGRAAHREALRHDLRLT